MINKFLRFLGIHVHEWSKWKDEDSYLHLYQERYCFTCGKRQRDW